MVYNDPDFRFRVLQKVATAVSIISLNIIQLPDYIGSRRLGLFGYQVIQTSLHKYETMRIVVYGIFEKIVVSTEVEGQSELPLD